MSHNSRWSVWAVVMLALLVVLLALRVATPRVRLTSGENLGHTSAREARKIAQDASLLQYGDGEEESFGNLPLFSEPPTSRPLPLP